MNCTVAMDCMEDNPSQSGVVGSARDNPITIDDDSLSRADPAMPD